MVPMLQRLLASREELERLDASDALEDAYWLSQWDEEAGWRELILVIRKYIKETPNGQVAEATSNK